LLLLLYTLDWRPVFTHVEMQMDMKYDDKYPSFDMFYPQTLSPVRHMMTMLI
jgi:hypothetical protein